MMTLQWKRNCKLTIQLDQSEPKALDLSEFKITFQVSQPTTEQPKAAEIYIYNLSSQTKMDAKKQILKNHVLVKTIALAELMLF